jgi:hypothetical protein
MAGMPPRGSKIEKREENPSARPWRKTAPGAGLEPLALARRPRKLPKHNGAAFLAYPLAARLAGGSQMRFILGIIIGCALTVGGAYFTDKISVAAAEPVMVNWDVVAKNFDSVTTRAREGWKKIAG